MLQVNREVLPEFARTRAARNGERTLILRSAAAPATRESYLLHDLDENLEKNGVAAQDVDNDVIVRTPRTHESVEFASTRT